MDITPYVGTLVTAFITAGATYAAIVSRLARLEVRIEHVEHDQVDVHTLSRQIAALDTKVDVLCEDVRKHNSVVERTTVLEQSSKAAWKQIDAIKDELKVKIVGTN